MCGHNTGLLNVTARGVYTAWPQNNFTNSKWYKKKQKWRMENWTYQSIEKILKFVWNEPDDCSSTSLPLDATSFENGYPKQKDWYVQHLAERESVTAVPRGFHMKTPNEVSLCACKIHSTENVQVKTQESRSALCYWGILVSDRAVPTRPTKIVAPTETWVVATLNNHLKNQAYNFVRETVQTSTCSGTETKKDLVWGKNSAGRPYTTLKNDNDLFDAFNLVTT